MLRTLCLIGLGSCLGGMARYLFSRVVQVTAHPVFPWGTLTVNVLGCLLIGGLYALFDRGHVGNSDVRLFLTTGFCGGFTTFSTFMYENYSLLQSGKVLLFMAYSMLSLVVGFGAVCLGIWMIHRLC